MPEQTDARGGDKAHPMLKKGAVHMASYWLRLLDDKRPDKPLQFMYAQLHRTRGGMRFDKEQLHEFVTNCPDVSQRLLVNTLLLSLPDSISDIRDPLWRDICLAAADLLLATFKTEKELPTEEALRREFGRVPFLMLLIISMAGSKLSLAALAAGKGGSGGAGKQQSLSVSVCLQLGCNGPEAGAHEAMLLRTVGEDEQVGAALIGNVVEELRWVTKGQKSIVWEVIVLDCSAAGRIAQIAQQVVNTSIPALSRENVSVVAAESFAVGMRRLAERKPDKKCDFVLLLQGHEAAQSHYVAQIGHLVAPLAAAAAAPSSKANISFLDLSTTCVASTARDSQLSVPPSWPLFSFLLQSMMRLRMPALPPFLASSVIVLRGDLSRELSALAIPAAVPIGPARPTLLERNCELFLKAFVFAHGKSIDAAPEKPLYDAFFTSFPAAPSRLFLLRADTVPHDGDLVEAVRFVARATDAMRCGDSAVPPAPLPPPSQQGDAPKIATKQGTAPQKPEPLEAAPPKSWGELFETMTPQMWLDIAVGDKMGWVAQRALASSASVADALDRMPQKGTVSYERFEVVAPQATNDAPVNAPSGEGAAADTTAANSPEAVVSAVFCTLTPEYVYGCAPWRAARGGLQQNLDKASSSAEAAPDATQPTEQVPTKKKTAMTKS